MEEVMAIGTPPWTRPEMEDCLDEFQSVYADRPIKDNEGGMKAPHMFALWFMARYLRPDLVVENGVWKGQSTWLLEMACPQATLISIDPELGWREYISDRAVYSDRDFVEHDWSEVSDRSLVFFDDHQDAYRRLRQCQWFGFKHVIFEDNYPVSHGDCYSLKKAFAHAGFEPARSPLGTASRRMVDAMLRVFARMVRIHPSCFIPAYVKTRVQPNDFDSKMLQKHLDVYYEFPPVFKAETTRWGDRWDQDSYPTPEPLLDAPTKPIHQVFADEARDYTWMCYARLK